MVDPWIMLAEGARPALDLTQDVMWPLGAAMVVGVLVGGAVERIGIRYELYDLPDAGLKPHEKPVPYLGGLAIFAGWCAAIWIAAAFDPGGSAVRRWITLGAVVFTATGFLDDFRGLPPALRIVIQSCGALILVGGGVGRELIPSLLAPWREGLPDWLFGSNIAVVLSALLCAAILSGATNASNLIDGMDGLCAGVMVIAALGSLFAYAYLFLTGLFPMPDAHMTLLVAATVGVLGAGAAFLRFNRHPASMFMGDSGSWLFGFNVAVVLILFAEHASWRGMLVGLTIFGFPIFDTALTIGRRKRYGRPLSVGDRSHFYDQIRDRGFTIRQTVWICYGLGLAFAAIGNLLVHLPPVPFALVLIALPLGSILVWLRLGMLRVDDSAARSEHGPSNGGTTSEGASGGRSTE